MDKDVEERMQQLVGELNALDGMARRASCMPDDRATAALIEAIKGLTARATQSAAAYASQRLREETTGSGSQKKQP